MMKAVLISSLLFAAYVTGGALTYGYYWNTHVWKTAEGRLAADAAAVGMAWPLYWASFPFAWVADAGICATRSFHTHPEWDFKKC